MTGKADYRPAPGYEDKLRFIGPTNSPIWVGRSGDVPGLLDDRFLEVYRAWQEANLGLGTPVPGTAVAEGVAILEGQYRAHFSPQRQILDRLDTLIRMLTGKGAR